MPVEIDDVEDDVTPVPAPETKPKPKAKAVVDDASTPFGITAEHRPATFDEVGELATKAETLLGNVHAMADATKIAIATERDRVFKLHSIAADAGDESFKRNVLKFANETADEAAAAYAKTLFSDAGTLPATKNLPIVLKQLGDLNTRLQHTLIVNASPAAMLDAHGNSDPVALERKLKLTSWFSQLGPAGIANAVRAAMVDGDLVTLSAACRALEKMPVKLRPITPNAIADRVFGKQHAGITLAARQVELQLEQATLLSTDLRKGSNLLAGARIKHALIQRELDDEADRVFGSKADAAAAAMPKNPNRTPTEKIADGVTAVLKKKRMF